MTISPDQWSRVSAIFDAVRQLPRDQRAAAVATAADGDALIAAEVEALLAADTDDDFLVPVTQAPFGSDTPASPRMLGRALGAYRVERELGRGGMGVVYEAVHADTRLEKRVAIKTLVIGLQRPELRWRFEREREILAGLTHPNIAALYDGGTTDDGVPYLVMEYVEGRRIDAWCDVHRATIPQRIDLFRQVCGAVQYAHGRLVVHRDLKPSNVLVTDDGTVKLLDFGIAKLLDDDAAQRETTIGAAAPLTIAYASPEQLRGASVSTASDVYSLGVMLYRLLTGSLPHDTDGRNAAEAQQLVSTQPPRIPSDGVTGTHAGQCGVSTVAALRDTLRGDLDAIVLMALRAEPERRYASADALSADLLRYLKGQPVQAKPDTLLYRARKFVHRQRALVIAGSLGLVATAIGTVSSVRSARAAAAEGLRTQSVTRVLQEMIGSSDPNFSRFGSAPTLTAVLESARARVAQEFSSDPRTRADFYRSFGNSYVTFNRPQLAKLMFDSAYALHSAVLGATSLDAARDLMSLAGVHRVLGDSDRGLDEADHSVRVMRAITPPPDSDLTRAEIDYANYSTASYFDRDLSVPMLRMALAREQRDPSPRWNLIARGEAVLAQAYLNQQQVAASDSAFLRSGQALAHDTIPTLDRLIALAFRIEVLQPLGKYAESLEPARSLSTLLRDRFGPDHFLLPEARGLQSAALLFSGQLPQARVLLDSAITLTTSTDAFDPAYLCNLFWQKVNLELAVRDTAAARNALTAATAQLARLGRQRPFFEATLTWSRAALDMASGQVDAARGHLQQVVQLTTSQLGPTHPMSVLADARLTEFNGRFPPRKSPSGPSR